ncbi:MAG: hypothetical protein LUG66_07120 [Clostridiales bacterium]|nr:hypothetical protein [Clostridiales bacterium]
MNEIYCPVYFRYLGNDYDAKTNFSENHDINYIEERIERILDPEKTDQSLFGTSGMAETYSTKRLALQFYDVQAEFNQQRKTPPLSRWGLTFHSVGV